jgi:hypothetical protein
VADFTFEGGAGSDIVSASNREDASTSYEMNIRGYEITKFDNFNTFLEYSGVESVDYHDNDGSNLIQFEAMETPGFRDVAVAIRGNGGNDTIYNSSAATTSDGNWPTAIGTGGAFVDGGAGIDTLQLSNINAGLNTYTFNPSSIDAGQGDVSAGFLSHLNCETIDVVSTSVSESVHVFSKSSTTALRFNSGGGDDTFTIGSGDFDNSGILLAGTTLLGGAGTDSFTVSDRSDADAVGEVENYTWNATTFAKGAAGFNYSEFESQTLLAANGILPGLNSVPQVNLNSISSAIGQTTVSGGNARSCMVNVGGGNLSANITGAVSLNLGSGSLDSINLLNTIPTGGTQYRLTQTQMVAPKVINYLGAEGLTINAGPGNDTFLIDGSPAGANMHVNGNNGNDSFTLGAGNLNANLLGSVIMNGGSGVEFVTVDNTLDASPATQVLSDPTFSDGRPHTFNTIEGLIINEGPGGVDLIVNKLTVPASINGDTGNDRFTVGGGDLDANLPAGASNVSFIRGGGGTDSIRFNDLNDTNIDSYFFQRPGGTDQLFKADGATTYFVNWLDIESVTLDASNAASSTSASLISVQGLQTPLHINGNGGHDSVQVFDAAFPVIVHTGLGDRDNLSVNSDGGPPILAPVVIEQDDDIENLTVATGGTLRITDGTIVAKTRLGLNPSLDINGVLDLAGGALLSRTGGPTEADFHSKLVAGRNGGSWNGAGPNGAIQSSLANASPANDAVGYAFGFETALSSIGPFSIDPGDILIRHTLDGDADLNQAVNSDDFNRLAANFGQTGKSWAKGDFNYDPTSLVSSDDFNALAGNFGQAVGASIFGIRRIGLAPDRLHRELTELG